MLDSYYKDKANLKRDQETDEENDAVEECKEQALKNQKKMSEQQLEDAIKDMGIQDQVKLILMHSMSCPIWNELFLFDPGMQKSDQKAYPLIGKAGKAD